MRILKGNSGGPGRPRFSTESSLNMGLSDTECVEQALREYREESWDDSLFEELPSEAQHTILRRAQEIKNRQRRLLSALDVRRRLAS
jgi:hypothetical protein